MIPLCFECMLINIFLMFHDQPNETFGAPHIQVR